MHTNISDLDYKYSKANADSRVIPRIMELVNHFAYYRKTVLATINDPKNTQSITPAFSGLPFFCRNLIKPSLTCLRKYQIYFHGNDLIIYCQVEIRDITLVEMMTKMKKSMDGYICSIEQIPYRQI